MAQQLLKKRGMIFKSEKRRLVGAEAPVIRAAIYGIQHSHTIAFLHSLIQQIALRFLRADTNLLVQY